MTQTAVSDCGCLCDYIWSEIMRCTDISRRGAISVSVLLEMGRDAPCFSFRRNRPWCTTLSTWWPRPRSAPPKSPSAPFSATGTNRGASDPASWTCSRMWVQSFAQTSLVFDTNRLILFLCWLSHQNKQQCGSAVLSNTQLQKGLCCIVIILLEKDAKYSCLNYWSNCRRHKTRRQSQSSNAGFENILFVL